MCIYKGMIFNYRYHRDDHRYYRWDMASSTTKGRLHPCPAGSLRRDNSSDFDEFLHGVSLACGFRRRCRGHWPVERRGQKISRSHHPSFLFLVPCQTREGRKCHYLVVFHGFSTCFDLFGDCYNMKRPHCLVPNMCKSRPPWVYASVYITLGGWLMGLFGGKSNTYPAMPAAGVSKVIGTLLNFEHASPAYPKFLHPK